jgi:hypothetical protein
LLCRAERSGRDIKWLPISGKNAYGKTDIRRNKYYGLFVLTPVQKFRVLLLKMKNPVTHGNLRILHGFTPMKESLIFWTSCFSGVRVNNFFGYQVINVPEIIDANRLKFAL